MTLFIRFQKKKVTMFISFLKKSQPTCIPYGHHDSDKLVDDATAPDPHRENIKTLDQFPHCFQTRQNLPSNDNWQIINQARQLRIEICLLRLWRITSLAHSV